MEGRDLGDLLHHQIPNVPGPLMGPDAGAHQHYDGGDLEVLASAHRYHDWIAEQFRPYVRGRVLEIGAGIGSMSAFWEPLSDELHLIEPARNLFQVLHSRFGGCPNVVLHDVTFESAVERDSRLAAGLFDAIIMINVLEHIEDDRGFMTRIGAYLAPAGHLLVFVPATEMLFGSMDEKFGHFRRYRRERLREVAESAGFSILRLRYFDVIGVLPWWLVGRLLRRHSISRTSAWLFDRFAVPLGRWIDRRGEMPFGKNLVLVARHGNR